MKQIPIFLTVLKHHTYIVNTATFIYILFNLENKNKQTKAMTSDH